MTELRSIVKYLYCIHFLQLNKADCLKSFATAMQSAAFGHDPEVPGTSSTITVELRSYVKDSSSSMEQVRADNRLVGLDERGSATMWCSVKGGWQGERCPMWWGTQMSTYLLCHSKALTWFDKSSNCDALQWPSILLHRNALKWQYYCRY